MSFSVNQTMNMSNKSSKRLKNLHLLREEINKLTIKLLKQDKIYEMKNKTQDLSVRKDKSSKMSVNSLQRTKVSNFSLGIKLVRNLFKLKVGLSALSKNFIKVHDLLKIKSFLRISQKVMEKV